MGICASCLGLDRRASHAVCAAVRSPLAPLLTASKPSESDALLYGDGLQPRYSGTAPEESRPDPEELRREREVLERICAETSGCGAFHAIHALMAVNALTPASDLIDVMHQNTSIKGSKIANDYPHLLNKHFSAHGNEEAQKAEEAEDEDEGAWIDSTHGADRDLWGEVKGLTPGALVVNLHEPAEPDAAVKKLQKSDR